MSFLAQFLIFSTEYRRDFTKTARHVIEKPEPFQMHSDNPNKEISRKQKRTYTQTRHLADSLYSFCNYSRTKEMFI